MKNCKPKERLSCVIIRISNSLLISLLSILGIACSEKEIPCEYGTPYANFQIKGKVTDGQNNPVQNALIQVKSPEANPEWLVCDTVYTDQQGLFEYKKTDFPVSKLRLITSGTEAEENGGLFTNDTTLVSFNREDFEGGDGWFAGTLSKEVNISLKKQVDTHTAPYTLYTIYGRVTDKDGYPLPGILISSMPSYTTNNPDDPYSYPAITNNNGFYTFTSDKATPTKHTIHASLYKGWWNWEAYYSDSTTINLADIPLSGGKGLLIGKGKKELNFILKNKDYKQ